MVYLSLAAIMSSFKLSHANGTIILISSSILFQYSPHQADFYGSSSDLHFLAAN